MERNVLITRVHLADRPFGQTVCIALKGSRIISVGEAPEGFAADEVVDGRGMLATAGMVNAHCHASMTLLRSHADDMALMDWLQNHIWPAESRLTDDAVYWGAMLGIAEMLKGGVTCFADLYFRMDRVAEAAATLGIRANLATCFLGTGERGAQTLPEAARAWEKWQGFDGGRLRMSWGPHASYTCGDELLRAASAEASRHHAEIHIHMQETQDEADQCVEQYGVRPFRRMEQLGVLQNPVIAAHCVHLNDEDREIMARHRVGAVHNPQSNLKLASGTADVPALMRRGIVTALGTDGPASNNNLDMLEEVRLAALLHKAASGDPQAVTAREAWRMGAESGAALLGFGDVGRLEAGYRADIVLWNMDRPHWHPRHNLQSLLVYAADRGDVDTVFVQGRRVVSGGRLLTFDEERIMEEADRCARRILS